MVRETRQAMQAKDSIGASTATEANKRKRKISPSPPSTSTTTSIKLVVPSSISESKPVNGEKKQKISLKLNSSNSSPNEDVVNGQPPLIEEEKEEEEEEVIKPKLLGKAKQPLSNHTREALALVISQMISHLPAPLNDISTIWLPPDFVEKEENTLSYVLKQDTLTWDELVEILHVFSRHLLAPCAYPNPMPSLSTFNIPIPPLPSHLPSHSIYNFCASLHSLMAHIAPSHVAVPATRHPNEGRWGLMQKTPAQGQTIGGDRFTSSADPREAVNIKKELQKEDSDSEKDDKSLVEIMAESGDKFGFASVVKIEPGHVPILSSSSSSVKTPSISESLIRRASLKMSKWKEQREARRLNGFGSIVKPVTLPPPMASTIFTPSFAPTFDSTMSSGAGYWDTIAGMHQRRKVREYTHRVWGRAIKNEEQGWKGCIETQQAPAEEGGMEVEGSESEPLVRKKNSKGESRQSVEEVLEENQSLVEELQSWQYLRLRRGGESWISDRERIVAEELLSSLTRLADNVSPADLLPPSSSSSTTSKIGLAHTLASRLIPTSSPSIRGTLDPRRPQALHDNLTIRIRNTPLGPTSSLPSTSSSSYNNGLQPRAGYTPGGTSTIHQPRPQQPPHTASATPSSSSYAYTPNSNNNTYQRPAYPSSHSNSNTARTSYVGNTANQSSAYHRQPQTALPPPPSNSSGNQPYTSGSAAGSLHGGSQYGRAAGSVSTPTGIGIYGGGGSGSGAGLGSGMAMGGGSQSGLRQNYGTPTGYGRV